MNTRTILSVIVAMTVTAAVSSVATIAVLRDSESVAYESSEVRMQFEDALSHESEMVSLSQHGSTDEVRLWIDDVHFIDDWFLIYEDDIRSCAQHGDIQWEYYGDRLANHIAQAKTLSEDMADGVMDGDPLDELNDLSSSIGAIVGAINVRCDLMFRPDYSIN